MVTVQSVQERKKNLMSLLSIAVNALYKDVCKDDASSATVKRYNRYLQNKTTLATIEISTTNYEYIDRNLLPIEKEVAKFVKTLKKKDKECLEQNQKAQKQDPK